jgi:YYY domain-containing protein
MLAVFIWWLIIEILGLITFPLAFVVFRKLSGRGYAFAQPLGLLLVSYTLWLAASLGFLQNSRAAIVFIFLLLALVSAFVVRRERAALADFWQKKRSLILSTEVVFTVAFVAYAFFRAYDPAINHTEQPMDFGFMNAILRSGHFPPRDAWLSGFAISYYYFGYLMMAVLTKLSALPAGVTYNLALSLIFAWTMRGAFGLVYDLTQGVRYGILGGVLVTVAGNLEGALEFLHAKGFGSEAFWRWIEIQDLTEAALSETWYPGLYWWWWRATRVIWDKNVVGKLPEVISEFPAFSFMLGDMHPHVMALPFGLLALALALNILKQEIEGQEGDGKQSVSDIQGLASDIWERLKRGFDGDMLSLFLVPFCLGALGFLNSWDFPAYSLVAILAYVVRFYGRQKRLALSLFSLVEEAVIFALWVGVLGVGFYLPFYIGFRSQVGGFQAVFYTKTRPHHYLIIFGLFLFVVVSFLVAQVFGWFSRGQDHEQVERVKRGAFLSRFLVIFALALGGAVHVTFVLGLVRAVLVMALPIMLSRPLVPLFLAVLLSLTGTVLWVNLRFSTAKADNHSAVFSLILIFTALLLTYGTEFVYVRDSFDSRMNTIFKLYYQSWVFLAVASAFGVYWIARRKGFGRYIWLGSFGVLLLSCLYYPVAAFYTKANGFANKPTLDGTAYLQTHRPAEYRAIHWLAEHADDHTIIVEATGCVYCERSRVSAWTGLPTILGWPGHERQWRGNNVEAGRREPDVATIYQSPDLNQVKTLLEQYNVRYVYVGQLERETYQLSDSQLARFGSISRLVYDQDGVKIFER